MYIFRYIHGSMSSYNSISSLCIHDTGHIAQCPMLQQITSHYPGPLSPPPPGQTLDVGDLWTSQPCSSCPALGGSGERLAKTLREFLLSSYLIPPLLFPLSLINFHRTLNFILHQTKRLMTF